MAVTGADYWYIAVLLGGNEAKWKRIERNEEDIKTLIEAERNSGIWCRHKPRRPWMVPFPAPRHWLPDMLTA